MSDLTLEAPAKINLSLKVLGKRADGFHELETLMVPLSGLSDTLHFQEGDRFSFSCEADDVPKDETNLVVKAVRVFEERVGIKVHYKITLEKRVPHGAGLGGGSSDAAFTLLGLNRLCGEPLAFEVLHDLASELGSDVPFFLYQRACLCRGRGEIIERVEQAEKFPIVLLKPNFAVSTKDAFSRWKDAKEVESFHYEAQMGPYGKMVNQLEIPVFEKFLFLGELKTWLLNQKGVKVAQMSGSGSTMITILEDIGDADTIITSAKETWDPNLFSWLGVV